MFETASAVFPEDILRPEKQDLETFVLGMHSIVEAQTCAARNYFEEGSVDAACPPLKALLHIMVHGDYQGMRIGDPGLPGAVHPRKRAGQRLVPGAPAHQAGIATSACGTATWPRWRRSVEHFRSPGIDVEYRLAYARQQSDSRHSPAYLKELFGTIGADPFHLQIR